MAKAGFDVDAWDAFSLAAFRLAVFDDEGAFDDFDDVVEGVVNALDKGGANVGVDAGGEDKKEDGGDGGVPEGEAATGGLKHRLFVCILSVACFYDSDKEFCIFNRVNNAIVSRTNTIFVLSAFKLFAALTVGGLALG